MTDEHPFAGYDGAVKLGDLIETNDVVIGLRARDVADAAAQILSRTLPRHGFSPAETHQAIDAVIAREREMPTLCGGSAIPHARNASLKSFITAIGTNPVGIIEGQRDPRVIIAFLSPESQRSEHLALLASLSRLASTPAAINAIAEATSPEDVVTLLQR